MSISQVSSDICTQFVKLDYFRESTTNVMARTLIARFVTLCLSAGDERLGHHNLTISGAMTLMIDFIIVAVMHYAVDS